MSLDIAPLIDYLGPNIKRGKSDSEFIVEGTLDAPKVIGYVDLGKAAISFVGSYSSFSEQTFEIIGRIAQHVKGQVFVEGEPWSPRDDEHSWRKMPWWGWIALVLFFPVLLLLTLIALPFLLLYLIIRLLLITRKQKVTSKPKSLIR